MQNKKFRSFLFTPAIKIKSLEKAREVNADIGILDLEDGVPKERKAEARRNVFNFFQIQPSFATGLRINKLESEEGIKDILLLLHMKNVPNLIIAPMVESADEIKIVRNLLSKKPLIKLYSTLETPKALSCINEIAKVSDGLIFGSADFSACMGINITWEGSLLARSLLAAAAASNEIPAIDTACFNLTDSLELEKECCNVKKLGFTGKAAIHPSQVQTINLNFSPSEDQINFAKNIIAEYNRSQGGISRVSDTMIGPPFVKMAKQILGIA
ncbi:(3S)-malyl-CoA thioesterase [Sporomusa rhizae]|uniref:HpcH/HpaI aldolase/citrate lyase family protein n=1 Tax=Sporomusa rhizae TaxID=357999 RepID=UPI00352A77C0